MAATHGFRGRQDCSVSGPRRLPLWPNSPRALFRSRGLSHDRVDRLDVRDRDCRSPLEDGARAVDRELLLRRGDKVLGRGRERVVMRRESDRTEDREGDDADDQVPPPQERLALVLVVTVVLRSRRRFFRSLRTGSRFEQNGREDDGGASESRGKRELEVEEED